jgi:hypothetical protein
VIKRQFFKPDFLKVLLIHLWNAVNVRFMCVYGPDLLDQTYSLFVEV